MTDLVDEQREIATQLSNWEKSIFAVSLPHAAAFGAFIGKFDFDMGAEQPEKLMYSLVLIVLSLPMISIWLVFVHDQLRNTFLRVGHMDKKLKIKHTAIYTVIFVFPVFFPLISMNYREYIDVSIYGPISMILITWMFSSVIMAGHYYRRILRTLGYNPND